MATFGKTDIGGITSNIYGQIRGWKGNVGESGTITKISVYLTWATNFRVAVYEGSDPSTASLLWESASIAHGGSASWHDVTVPDVPFNAGGMILGIQHDSNNQRVTYDTVAGGGIIKTQAYGAFPDPLGAGSSDTQYSVYATYTPSGATYTRTWDADVLFKKLGVTKSLGADVAFQKRDIQLTVDADALFQKLDIQKTADVDVLFRKLDLLESFGVDVDFLKQDIIRSFGVDVQFGAVVAHEIGRQVDALFKKLGITKTFGVDTLTQKQDITETADLDVLFQKKAEIQKQVDTLFQKLDLTKSLVVDVAFRGAAVRAFGLDADFLKSVFADFGADVLFLGEVECQFGVDVCFRSGSAVFVISSRDFRQINISSRDFRQINIASKPFRQINISSRDLEVNA